MPLAVYGLDDGESTKMLFASLKMTTLNEFLKQFHPHLIHLFTVKKLRLLDRTNFEE